MFYILHILLFSENETNIFYYFKELSMTIYPVPQTPYSEKKKKYMSGENVTFTIVPSYYMNVSNNVTYINCKWIRELVCQVSLMHFQHVFIGVSEDW